MALEILQMLGLRVPLILHPLVQAIMTSQITVLIIKDLGAAQRIRVDLDNTSASSKPSLSRLPGVVDVERELRELLQQRHFRGLLPERGRPELIRNRAWPEGEVINSQEQYEGCTNWCTRFSYSRSADCEKQACSWRRISPFLQIFESWVPLSILRPWPCLGTNSCALDSCIVAARLLNVGSLSVDKGDISVYEWIESLPKLTLDFLQLLTRPWEIYPSVHNTFWKYQFRKKLGPTCQNGNTMSVVDLWKRCTEGVNQFKYPEYWNSRCSRCGRETSSQSNPYRHARPRLGLSQSSGKTSLWWKP